MEPAFAWVMDGAASAHQAASASREQSSQQRAVRTRRTSADLQQAQQGQTAAAAAAPTALDSLSRLQQLADVSPRVAQLRRLQALANARFASVAQLAGGPEEEEPVQDQFATAELQPQLQQAPRAYSTGLPGQLKAGVESLYGSRGTNVKDHYNSAKPAQPKGKGVDEYSLQRKLGRVKPTVQLKGNKKRWTPKQREQSEKFWQHKHARLERQRQGQQRFIDGMKKDHGLNEEQAIVLRAHGFSRGQINSLKQIGIDNLVSLSKSGFSRWAINEWAINKFDLSNLTQWTNAEAPEKLINDVLRLAKVDPWIEANHAQERLLGNQRVEENKNKISAKFPVNINKVSGGAFVLTEEVYKSAVAFLSVKQALTHKAALDSDILELVSMRIAISASEHAIQDGSKIYFKKTPDDSTVVHELVHFYGAQEKFIQNFCFGKADGINEGFTEYFARLACNAKNKNRERSVYRKEVEAVTFLVELIGKDILQEAYFTGNVNQLKILYRSQIGAEWSPQEEARITAHPTVKKG